ncbi:hypothetical protein NBRC10513v2_001954 [Rhodotorula toruloides]
MAASTNVNGSSQASTSMKRVHNSSSDSEECSDSATGGRPGGKGKVRKVNKSRSWPQSMDAHLVEVANLVNNMVSSEDFAKIDFAETLGPDLFPMSASSSLRQKGSRSVRDAATQTDSSFATSAYPRPACACNPANARSSVLVLPYKVPTPQHPQSSLTAANTAPSLNPLTVDASAAADLAAALPTLRAAGISSTTDLVNLLLLEDGIFELFLTELGESEKLHRAELEQAKQRLRDARSEIRRR